MEWWTIAGIIGLIIGLFIIFRKKKNEDIFESAGNRIKKIGLCCKKLFGD